ncbi:MAG: polysaccharide lyase family 1 protein [Chitinophagales bacterium]|nr:polysaccharide lyase family 1 protein [Chitinophagales bacterium]
MESTSPLNITFAFSGTISMTSDISIRSNKTVDGNGSYIRIRPFGFRIDNQSNIIIRNLHFDSDHFDHGGSGDAINIINGSTNIWVDHCSFEDWYDGTIDVTVQSDYVTISWCYFRSHGKTILIGASDSHTSDAGKLRVTLHHNYFDGTNQRHPRSRFGKVHVYNNWFKNLGSYGIVSAADTQTYIEKCRFENVSTPAQLSATSNYVGFISATGNQMVNSGSIPTTGGVFTPSSQYTYSADVANTLCVTCFSNTPGTTQLLHLPSQQAEAY